ncbi:MAG: hypothetical protein KZQ93_15850 [Candidatus Thiodiazotropha sp. (ex Monitilora ramsayi)]|nr:hypothetical protein [Candidatus Thiodiazotropha sp. (ex Monitilora ramsayi)]
MPPSADANKSSPPWWVFLLISLLGGGTAGLGSFTTLGNRDVQPSEADRLNARIDLVEDGARQDREKVRSEFNEFRNQTTTDMGVIRNEMRRIDYECQLVNYKCQRLEEEAKRRGSYEPASGDMVGRHHPSGDIFRAGLCQFSDCDGG